MKIRNVVLIGFMSTGKTSVGKRLVKQLNWDFIDTDFEIEKDNGMNVSEIFRKHGETYFRSEEERLIKSFLEREHCVIATGGGAVLSPENWKVLSQIGYIIALYAPIDTILERVGKSNDRPLFKSNREEDERLLLARQPIYNKAELIINTTEMDVDQVVEEIMRNIEGRIEGESTD